VSRDRNPDQWTGYNKAPRIQHVVQHHDPLATQLVTTRTQGVGSTKFLKNLKKDTNENSDEEFLDEKSTERLLKMSKQQINDLKQEDENETEDTDEEEVNNNNNNDSKSNKKSKSKKNKKQKSKQELPPSQYAKVNNDQNTSNVGGGLSLEELLKEDGKEHPQETEEMESQTDNVPFEFQQQELTAEEEAALEMFMPQSKKEQTTLTETIIKRYKENQKDSASTIAPSQIISRKLPRAAIQMFKSVANICKNWTNGKLPQSFKMIPQLDDWEEILYLCKPDEWTPHIMYEAVKAFVSQGKVPICQRFFNIVLLPRIRQDIKENKKLNFHLYQAVRKALFKPQAFFKGFLLPLCQSQCSAREAVIIGSVLHRSSIPVVHSALAMYRLLELEFSGPCHYLLRIFLNKRYALPIKVINALVDYFAHFKEDPRAMPVIWHQSLLSFIQNYKSCLDDDQKKRLKPLLSKQFHKSISSVIKKELSLANRQSNQNNMSTMMDVDI